MGGGGVGGFGSHGHGRGAGPTASYDAGQDAAGVRGEGWRSVDT